MYEVLHWTKRSNLQSIRRLGVDPRFARGSYKRVYAVFGWRLAWALDHVRKRHNIAKRTQMVLLRLYVPEEACKRFRYNGVVAINNTVHTWKEVD